MPACCCRRPSAEAAEEGQAGDARNSAPRCATHSSRAKELVGTQGVYNMTRGRPLGFRQARSCADAVEGRQVEVDSYAPPIPPPPPLPLPPDVAAAGRTAPLIPSAAPGCSPSPSPQSHPGLARRAILARHEDRLHRRRPRRPVLRAADEEAGPGARHHRGRAQPALRHLRLGRRVLATRRSATCAAADPETAAHDRAARSTTGTTSRSTSRAARSRSGGHGFCGIGRKRLLNILQARCEALGVKLVFETDVHGRPGTAAQYNADLVIACDGLNSRIRARYADVFQPDIDAAPMPLRLARHAQSCSTRSRSPSRRPSTAGSRRTPTSSTTRRRPSSSRRPRTSGGAGLDKMEQDEAIAYCERLFAQVPRWPLADQQRRASARLGATGSASRASSASTGRTGIEVNGKRVPVVLMGDAAHTAHFSIGSGTKLALEDAIELARAHRRAAGDLAGALAAYEAGAASKCCKIQNAARNSTEWFENVDALYDMRGRAVRLLAAHAQPAHQPREPAPARRG